MYSWERYEGCPLPAVWMAYRSPITAKSSTTILVRAESWQDGLTGGEGDISLIAVYIAMASMLSRNTRTTVASEAAADKLNYRFHRVGFFSLV